MALLTRGQRQFASTLAARTGLNPRVIGSWLLAEQSGSAARSYENKRYFNFLNIARTDSGDAHGAHSSVWGDPNAAANATADWLSGHGRIAKEYGKPAGGIRRILNTAGHDAGAQIGAIASSGWASSGYNGGSTLRSLYHELGGEHIPAPGKAAAGAQKAPNAPQTANPAASPAAPAVNQLLLSVLQQNAARAAGPTLGAGIPRQGPNARKPLGYQPPAPPPSLEQLVAQATVPGAAKAPAAPAAAPAAPAAPAPAGNVRAPGKERALAKQHPELKPKIREATAAVLQRFPGLSITSTNTGNHVPNSYHYRDEAVDIGGSPAEMRRAAGWIRQNLPWLTEAIHNPNLAIKNGKRVSGTGVYGAVWEGHKDHIHIAAA